MNSRILPALVLFLFTASINAQQASRFPVKPGSVWRINYEYSFSCSNSGFVHENGDEEYKYFVSGDTVIKTRTYFKLYKTGLLFLDLPFRIENKYMGALRDSADRFYFLEKEEQSEKLLYDFSLDEGDSIAVEGSGTKYPIEKIDTLDDGRKIYRLFILSVNCGSENTIIEGIGWLGGLLEGNSCSGHPGIRGSYLVCYSEEDVPAYVTGHMRCGAPAVCSNIITSTAQSMLSSQPEMILLPGDYLKISLPRSSGDLYDIEITDVMGKMILRRQSDLTEPISIHNLGSGTYIVRLGRDSKVHTAKFTKQ
jgi:hypothetical protein